MAKLIWVFMALFMGVACAHKKKRLWDTPPSERHKIKIKFEHPKDEDER